MSLFFLLGFAEVRMKTQDARRVDIVWRVEVYLHFFGTIGKGEQSSRFDFEMAQILSMARDNGDYLFADASMPVCRGKFQKSEVEEKTWTDKDEVPLEPRLYYMDRDNGRCYLPLVIQERSWPGNCHIWLCREVQRLAS